MVIQNHLSGSLLQDLIVKLILMTVPATLVCTEPVWMGSIATVVSALQDSQVLLLAFRGASNSPELEKGPLSESHWFFFLTN